MPSSSRRNSASSNNRSYYSSSSYVDATGRIVPPSRQRPRFSLLRCLTVVAVVLGCLLTNPANHDVLSTMTTRSNRREPLVSKLSKGRVTNYGLFSIRERLTRIQFLVLGTEINCGYDNVNTGWLCETVRNEMCHERPLLWDPKDRAHTAYRCTAWMMFVGALIVACCDNPSALWTGNIVVDAILCCFLPGQQQPITVLWDIVQSSMILFPALQRMDRLITFQHEDSVFKCLWNDNSNYWFSVLLLLGLGVATHHVTFRWSGGKSSLRWDAVLAVALGYYRGSFGNLSAPNHERSLMLFSAWSMSLTTLTWTRLLMVAVAQSSMAGACGWLGGNLAGSVLGQYQYENQVLQTAVRGFFNSVEGALEGLFFGFR